MSNNAKIQIQVGNAPCSWGVLEFGLTKQITFRTVLDEMASAGYRGTDLGDWGFMPTDPATLAAALHERNLAMISAFVPVDLSHSEAHADGEATAIRTARLLAAVGGAFIVLADLNGSVEARVQTAGRIRPEHGLDTARWLIFANGANRIAKAVHAATGLRTVFHHHCAGYIETPGEVEMLLRLTDPRYLGLCLDTGHYVYGGGDPLFALEAYRERIWLVHFKDCCPDRMQQARAEGWDYFGAIQRGLFCELGQGAVNFPAIAHDLASNHYEGWVVVEQDVLPGMGSPLESAQRNRHYLESIGL